MNKMSEIKWNKPVKKNLAVYILYDRSGSMRSRQEEAVSSTNAYVKALDAETAVTIVAFDSSNPHEIVRDHILVSDFKPLSVDEVFARSMTPLYDAAGLVIDGILNDNPERAVLVIQTDGEENGSRKYNRESIMKRVAMLEQEKHYEVVFLGSEFNNVQETARNTGVLYSKSLNRTAGNYEAVASALASATRSYGVCGQSINFSDDLKTSLGDNTVASSAKPFVGSLNDMVKVYIDPNKVG